MLISNALSELNYILNYCEANTVDEENGRFIDQIDYNNKNKCRESCCAKSVYNYIIYTFCDKVFGGVFWSLDYKGIPKDSKDKIYAIAFVIYSLTEYFKISEKGEAFKKSVKFYKMVD